jgi:hypothetical protein
MSYLDDESGELERGDAFLAKAAGLGISAVLAILGLAFGGSGGGGGSTVVSTTEASRSARTQLEQDSPFRQFFTRIRDEHPEAYRAMVDGLAERTRFRGSGATGVDISPYIDRFIYSKRESLMRASPESLRALTQARLRRWEGLRAQPELCAGTGPNLPMVALESDPTTALQLGVDLAMLDAMRAGEQPGSREHRPPTGAQLAALAAAVDEQPARAVAVLTMEPDQRAAVSAAERCDASIAYERALLALPDAALAAFVADRYRNLEPPEGMARPTDGAASGEDGQERNAAAPARR